MQEGRPSATRVAIVATVKAPLAILRPWIRYHLEIGIEHLVLFFDDPADPAADALAGDHAITGIRCTDAYWARVNGYRPAQVPPRQIVNLEQGMAMVQSMGIGWMAHVDCDELIRPLAPLGELLLRADADALKMTLLEAVSERSEYRNIFEARLFKRLPTRNQARAARLLGCFRAFRYGEYFRGHTESKTLVRLGGGVKKMNVHKPVAWRGEPDMRHVADIQLLHFDGVGFADWDSKWATRTGNQFGMRPARSRQLEAYRRAARKDLPARRALFMKSQMIPRREQALLKRMGLLERIELDKAPFEA